MLHTSQAYDAEEKKKLIKAELLRRGEVTQKSGGAGFYGKEYTKCVAKSVLTAGILN